MEEEEETEEQEEEVEYMISPVLNKQTQLYPTKILQIQKTIKVYRYEVD